MSAWTLAPNGAESTVKDMYSKTRSPVVARVEIISSNSSGSLRYTVLVERSGRVRTAEVGGADESNTQVWTKSEPPSLDDLAGLLIAACQHDYHALHVRLVSAVVHGLLPTGEHLWDQSVEVPDAVLDERLSFDHTTYRIDIQKKLAEVLKNRPDTAWALQIQSDGTSERAEFVRQVSAAASMDPKWLHRTLTASRSGSGTPFADLVLRNAPVATHTRACYCEQARTEVGDLGREWACVWGVLDRELHDEHNGDFHLRACFGEHRPGQITAWLLGPEGDVLREVVLGAFESVSLETASTKTAEQLDDLVSEFVDEYGATAAEWDEPDASMTIYWDSLYGGNFSLVPEGWEEGNIAPLHQVAASATWGEVRAVSKPGWLERLLESHIEDRADDGVEITDATQFRVADLGMDISSLLDHMVVPWDLESLSEWFPEEDMGIIEAHCWTGGASPGGNINVYTPKDEEALIGALRSRGYNVVQRAFLSDLEQALEQFSASAKPPNPSEPIPPVFEQVNDYTVVVYEDDIEVEWSEYADGIPDEALLVGFWSDNGWGYSETKVFLVAPGVVVESHVCDDIRSQRLYSNVVDVAGIAIDCVRNDEMRVALAVDAYGPLFDGNTALTAPLLPMTPWESSPFAIGNNSVDDPGLHWGSSMGAADEVMAEFRRRVEAGSYPNVSRLRKVGSTHWRRWVIGLLTAVPLTERDAADKLPLVPDSGDLESLSTNELLEMATKILSR